MKIISFAFLLSSSFLFCSSIIPKEREKDYLSVPGPVKFGNIKYVLAWSSHPTATYYDQEYIPKGETINSFNRMVLINVVISDTLKVRTILEKKIHELEERKKNDAVINYKVFRNPDQTECIIDFMESQGSKTSLNIVEWNAYRYKIFIDKAGNKGVMLFGISIRAYGNEIRDFFDSLKITRNATIISLIKYNIPDVQILK